ncbi:type I polyketide synthase [Candidatus Symbiopectobacterium sp. NZEC135]|uniref:type I polyketide synthase n=1 Tax=Candidatus Symbiopectobacterium sp. NZEC135 TaxID=2820471 RepID=UPI0022275A35|nr:type I polyketide synthase [Candidatus Symbiopectobacterium sp. NZEC135]MCW2479353.1 SDR family NAD(P)-dependent oxidoreductase [Candidatus Symbiopectobacterium sp. NZEC135]
MNASPEPIAIVGMACRFPGAADNLAHFWQLLCESEDAIGDVPPDRWEASRFYHPDKDVPGKMYVNQGGFIRQRLDQFDNDFFAISPREAASMDPQQRLLMEVAYEALCDAGLPLVSLRQQAVGVFIGGFTLDRTVIQLRESNRHLINAHSAPGMTMTILSARLAHWLDVSGPCMSLDTACSSSLVALHLAAQSIAHGECHTALVGGVNAMLIPDYGIAMCKGQFLSPEGRCKAFAESADGYVRAEGAGIVVLKPLSRAQAEGDRIYACLLGTGVNHNGHTTGIAQPNTRAQQALMRAVQRRAGVTPEQIDYVEAHGTGTRAGDSAESEALGNVIGLARKASGQSLLVGAVKSNIGHTEAAAGVAGLIKTALVLHHQTVPANLHGEHPNPDIPFTQLGLSLVNVCQKARLTVAAVNSFGYGGTNAHAILSRYTAPPMAVALDRQQAYTFPLSAQSPAALRDMAANYARFIHESPADVSELCAVARLRCNHLRYRALILASDKSALVEQLGELAEQNAAPSCVLTEQPGVVFVFSGMGSGYRGMARELWENERAFRQAFTACDKVFQVLQPQSCPLYALLWGNDEGRASDAELQVAIVAIQIALVALWRAQGIVPAVVVGHSAGEMAAVYTAGILSLEDTMRLAIARSQLQHEIEGQGRLLAVEMDASTTQRILMQWQDKVDLAAVNTDTAKVLSGDEASLTAIARQLREEGIFQRFASVHTPYHSHYLDVLRRPALEAFSQLLPQPQSIPFCSTVRAGYLNSEALDAVYWWENMRNTVQFDAALQLLVNEGHKLFLEIGGHPVLSPYLKKVAGEAFFSQHRKMDAQTCFQQQFQRLWCAGAAVDWQRQYATSFRSTLRFPDYPWQRTAFDSESTASLNDRRSDNQYRLPGKRLDSPQPAWEQTLDNQRFSWLWHHKVAGSAVFPAAGYIQAALQASVEVMGNDTVVLENVRFERMCTLSDRDDTRLRLDFQKETGHWRLSSTVGAMTPWTQHASGQTCQHARSLRASRVDIDALRRRCTRPYTANLSARFAHMGLEYGPSFTLVQRVILGQREAIADIQPVDSLHLADFLVHPAVLDAGFQALLALVADTSEAKVWLPTRVRQILFYRPLHTARHLHVHARCHCVAEHCIEGDITLFDDSGAILLEILGLRCDAVNLIRRDPLEGMLYQWQWQSSTIPELWSGEYRWMVQRHFWPPVDSLIMDSVGAIISPPDTPHQNLAEALLQFSRLIHWRAKQVPPQPVVVVTVNATAGPGQSAPVSYTQSAFWGMARTLQNELPQLDLRMVDLDTVDEACFSRLLSLPRRGEYCQRKGNLYQHQWVRVAANALRQPTIVDFVDDNVQRVVLTHQETPHYSLQMRILPEDDDVEIQVVALAVSPERYHAEATVGDITGIVTRAGHRSGFRMGDHVAAILPDQPYVSHVTLNVKQSLVVPLPQRLSVSTDPVLLHTMTALACLRQRVQLAAGDMVLIVGQDVGVIQAAIDLAKTDNAIVLVATLGSARMQAYRVQGADAVFDCADPLWRNDVLAWVGEQGVNVILHQADGMDWARLMPLLTDFGVFVAFGSAMAPLSVDSEFCRGRNLSFFSVDCCSMQKTRPAAFRQLALLALTALTAGEIRALPPRIFSAEQVVQARGYAVDDAEVSRTVLQFQGKTMPVRRAESKELVDKTASYLVTGGVRGLGFTMATWLVEQGVRDIILVSLTGMLPPAQRVSVSDWRNSGVRVRIEACDMAKEHEVRQLLMSIDAHHLPLKGIIHCAASLEDAASDKLTLSQLQNNLGAKLSGAVYLHQYTQTKALDWFILFSSITAIVGNPGQAGYAAANAALDALSELRQQQNLPILSVNWGAIDDTGMVANNAALVSHLARMGITCLPTSLLGELLRCAVNGDIHQLAFAHMDWATLADYTGTRSDEGVFQALIADNGLADEKSNVHQRRLLALPEAERSHYLAGVLAHLLKQVLGADTEDLDIHQSTAQFGLDSLMYMEFQMQIRRTLQVEFSANELLSGLSVRELAERAVNKMG